MHMSFYCSFLPRRYVLCDVAALTTPRHPPTTTTPSRYARMFNSTGKAFLVENCHAGDCTDDDNSGCATVDWCPFTSFRASRDIDNTDTRWFLNLQGAVRFLDRVAPVSQPGCWAYGDMMQIGRLSTFELNRAHFSVRTSTMLALSFYEYDVGLVILSFSPQKNPLESHCWAAASPLRHYHHPFEGLHSS